MKEIVLIEYFTSLPQINHLENKTIFSEAINLVDNVSKDLTSHCKLKKLHIVRNHSLKKLSSKKIKYHLTSSKVSLKRIINKFSKINHLIFIAPESEKIMLKMYKELKKKFILLHSNSSCIEIFSSKRKTFLNLKKNQIDCIQTLKNKHSNTVPLIIKPNYGAGSEKIFFCKNSQKPAFLEDYVIQEYHKGLKGSFTMLCDKGKYLVISCNKHIMKHKNKKISQVGSVVGKYEQYRPEFEKIAAKLSKKFKGLLGFIGVDVIKLKNNWAVVDVNCRFTSSYIGLKSSYGKEIIRKINNFYVSKELDNKFKPQLIQTKEIYF